MRQLLFVLMTLAGGIAMAQEVRVQLKPRVSDREAQPAQPKSVRSDLAVKKEVHGKIAVLTCSDGGVAVAHREGLLKPSLTLVESHPVEAGFEYTYKLKNAADAEAEINQVVFWTGEDRPSIYYVAEGVQPGQEVQLRVTSKFPAAKQGVRVSMAYANPEKRLVEREPFLHLMDKPLSEECRASIARNHDARAWVTISGPGIQ